MNIYVVVLSTGYIHSAFANRSLALAAADAASDAGAYVASTWLTR